MSFQQCWSFEECRVPLHYHCSQVHFDSKKVAPDKGPIYGSNRANKHKFLIFIFLIFFFIFVFAWKTKANMNTDIVAYISDWALFYYTA